MTCIQCSAVVQPFSNGRARRYCDSCGGTTCPRCGCPKMKQAQTCRACRTERDRIGRVRTCIGCHNEFVPKRSNRISYCSRECAFSHVRATAAKYISKSRVYFKTCACGIVFTARRHERTRCSSCRLALSVKAKKTCQICKKSFVPVHAARRTCSAACNRAAVQQSRRRKGRHDERARRRARKRGAFVARVVRKRVFERDGWKCRICGKPTKRNAKVPDPKAPVLDHIIPLAKGGIHAPVNVQCAHFICNSLKSDRSMGEQLLLVG